jgi:hypothetical protein
MLMFLGPIPKKMECRLFWPRRRTISSRSKTYEQVFPDSRLRADSRQIVLCYKVQFRRNRIIREIKERGINKYQYMSRACNLLWGLLCQAVLNDDKLENYSERFGHGLAIEADYTDWLEKLALQRGFTKSVRRCRQASGILLPQRQGRWVLL